MFESKINRGKANGYTPLDGDGKVSLSHLPDVVGVAGTSGTSGVSGTSGTSVFADSSSLATTGSNTFTGTQTISGSGDALFTIGASNSFGGNSFDLRATGSEGSIINMTSNAISQFGAFADINDYSGDVSVFSNSIIGGPVSDGPIAGILVQKSGSFSSTWLFDYDGKSAFPGDINIGYEQFGSGLIYSGSLNVKKGNINVSGSVNISSSLVVSSTIVNNGTIDAFNSDLIIDGGDIILSGSFAQQVNYAPFGSGSWEMQAIGEVTELDITKDIHLIDITAYESYSHFYLPNGLYDGQIVRFALKGNGTSSPNTVLVWMDNLRTFNGSLQSNTNWSPFYDDGYGSPRSLATALYVDGAWNIDTDYWDM